jgi:hypothetical protein
MILLCCGSLLLLLLLPRMLALPLLAPLLAIGVL